MAATARDLLATKNSAVVYTCARDASVREACEMMRDRRVGALVVVRGGELQGLLTERDVVRHLAAEGRDPWLTRVDEVMERNFVTVPLDARCEEIEALLRRRRARYVPVVGARGLLGMISLGDLARYHAAREHERAGGVLAAARG